MKLKDLVPETETRMDKFIIADKFILFLREGKENHWYIKDFDTWAAAMCRDAIYKPSEICDMYKKYNANDTHVLNLIKHCMKKRGWL